MCRLGARLPEVEEGTFFGSPALRVRGSILARAADRKKSVLLKAEPAARARLCAERPSTFYVPPGEETLAFLGVRLGAISGEEMWPLLVESWRRSAPPSLASRLSP